VIARSGDQVIDGRLTARLLGVRLLDIDAHVVVAAARDAGTTSRPARNAGVPSRPAPPAAGADGRAPALRRAVRLLDEGSSALEDARQIRHRSGIRRPGPG
jgi:hypothetical protein